jgi:mono/diheme cytochrome c family protein
MPRRTVNLSLAALSAVAVLLTQACKGDETATVAATECASTVKWIGGDEGSEHMHPGADCVECHTRKGEGPKFAFAGTVFPDYKQADDCYGSDMVEITLTGADGKVLTLSSNEAGNFTSRDALALPYKASVTYQGRTRSMIAPQTNGACNSCHTQNGANDAPGRILLP